MEQNAPQEVKEVERGGFLGSIKRLAAHRYANLIIAATFGVLGAVAITIVMVGAAQTDQEVRQNTDPRVGVVYIKDSHGRETGVRKVCDGTTLVYLGGMFASDDAIPDSRECR